MPRIRSIKPQFWLDEQLGQIPRDARLLYIGLWNLSDDQGVFEWRPTRIKVQLFPYDNDLTPNDIESWLELLVKTDDICKFTNGNGECFGFIKSFLKHQEIKNPSKWKFATVPVELTITTPALPQQGVCPTPALPLGRGSRFKGVGSRLKGVGSSTTTSSEDLKMTFEEYLKQLQPQFADLDFEGELKKFNLYWSEGGRKLKRPKLALLKWMEKARQISAENDAQTVSARGHKRQVRDTSDPNRFKTEKFKDLVATSHEDIVRLRQLREEKTQAVEESHKDEL